MKHVNISELRLLQQADAVLNTIMRWNGAVVELDVKLPVGWVKLVSNRLKDGQPRVRQFRNPDELRAVLDRVGIRVTTVDLKNQRLNTL